MIYLEDEIIKNKSILEKGEYYGCTFENCDFSTLNFADIIFIECNFYECNLSNIKPFNTSFKTVDFFKCKLIGIDFTLCKPFLFKVNFDESVLNFCSFYQLNLKNSNINNCILEAVDFTECDLSNASFNNSNLKNAIFERTKLNKADFRMAKNFAIHPENNNIQNAVFSKESLFGLVQHHNIKVE